VKLIENKNVGEKEGKKEGIFLNQSCRILISGMMI